MGDHDGINLQSLVGKGLICSPWSWWVYTEEGGCMKISVCLADLLHAHVFVISVCGGGSLH